MTTRWRLYENRLVGFQTSSGYGVYLYLGTDAHPLATVRWNGVGNNASNFPFQIHVQTGATGGAATAEDWLTDIYDETTGLWQQFFAFQPDTTRGANNYVAQRRKPEQPTGNGYDAVTATSISASGTAILIADAANRTEDSYRIRHALNWVCWRNKKHTDRAGVPEDAAIIGTQIWWPASSGDTGYATSNNGVIPYGANLALPPEDKGGPNISSLGLTVLGRRLAYALRDYGSFITDGGPNIQMRGQAGCANVTEIREQLTILRGHLRVVTNNLASQTVTGGGAAIPGAINCGYQP